jgi:hypothetical protein
MVMLLPLLSLLLFLTYQCQNRKEEREKEKKKKRKKKIGKAYIAKARVPFCFSLSSFFLLSNSKVPMPYLGSTHKWILNEI